MIGKDALGFVKRKNVKRNIRRKLALEAKPHCKECGREVSDIELTRTYKINGYAIEKYPMCRTCLGDPRRE